MKDQHGKQEFKYLSEERIKEVHRVFESFNQADMNFFPGYGSYFHQGLYETGEPFFKKFSIFQYEGIDFKLTTIS